MKVYRIVFPDAEDTYDRYQVIAVVAESPGAAVAHARQHAYRLDTLDEQLAGNYSVEEVPLDTPQVIAVDFYEP